MGSPDEHLKNKGDKTRINHDIVLLGTNSSMVIFTRLLFLFTESAWKCTTSLNAGIFVT